MLAILDHLSDSTDAAVLVRGLQETNWTSPERLIAEIQRRQVPVLRPETDVRRPMLWRRLVMAASTVRLIRAMRPDVVHVHTSLVEGGRLVTLLARIARVPTVIRTEHNSPSAFGSQPFGSIKQRVVDRLSAVVITVSEADRDEQIELVGRSPESVVSLPNGVDSKRFAASEPAVDETGGARRLRVGSIGRLHPQKDHRTLIRAMQLVVAQEPGIELVIVGDGDLRQELEMLVTELDLDQHVTIGLPVNDVVPVLASFDIGVMSSVHEGLSVALLEMMSMGLPTVVTDIAGLTEAAVADETSLVVPVGDAEALALAIIDLARDSAKRRRLGVAARQRVVSEFSIEDHCRKLEAIYRTAAGRQPPPSA